MSDDWEVVEEALKERQGIDQPWYQGEPEAALARLREREAQLERERDAHVEKVMENFHRAEAAEARVAELTLEIDVLKAMDMTATSAQWEGAYKGSLARIAELEEALREIAERGPGTVASNRARRGLGKYPDYKDGAWVAHKEETP